MVQDLADRLQEEHMRNEALLFALKQQRDGAGGEPVARGVSIGTGSNKRSHASGSDPCPPGHHKNTRSTADVGVQMVHSQVFALDAIIQCKLCLLYTSPSPRD